MTNMLTGFREFLLRGNLIELAVGLVMALAFVAVVNSLITNLFTPIIALIIGESRLGAATFEISDSVFFYGQFIDDLIQFIAIGFAVYFFVILPYNSMMERRRRGDAEEEATTRACPECTTIIALEARRCPACTSQLVTS